LSIGGNNVPIIDVDVHILSTTSVCAAHISTIRSAAAAAADSSTRQTV